MIYFFPVITGMEGNFTNAKTRSKFFLFYFIYNLFYFLGVKK